MGEGDSDGQSICSWTFYRDMRTFYYIERQQMGKESEMIEGWDSSWVGSERLR